MHWWKGEILLEKKKKLPRRKRILVFVVIVVALIGLLSFCAKRCGDDSSDDSSSTSARQQVEIKPYDRIKLVGNPHWVDGRQNAVPNRYFEKNLVVCRIGPYGGYEITYQIKVAGTPDNHAIGRLLRSDIEKKGLFEP